MEAWTRERRSLECDHKIFELGCCIGYFINLKRHIYSLQIYETANFFMGIGRLFYS